MSLALLGATRVGHFFLYFRIYLRSLKALHTIILVNDRLNRAYLAKTAFLASLFG